MLYGVNVMRTKVLITTGFYIPSVKGGGPIQSIKNIVSNLSDDIDFYILTRDRDLGDDNPFQEVVREKWIDVGNARVYYVNHKKLTFTKLINIIRDVDCDVLYLNGFFPFKLSIMIVAARKLKLIDVKKTILAPRGEFSKGALELKKLKKTSYIMIAKVLNLYKNITWHATTGIEEDYIKSIFGKKSDLYVAQNMTENYKELSNHKNIAKNKGELKVIFISRIHPKKNLKHAIEVLSKIHGKIQFNIYGPIEDEKYWDECQTIIRGLPDNIKTNYFGVVEHKEIIDVFRNHHIFLFPTLGENYGHIISEALIGGCPIVISDQTPWIGLEKEGVGWDIELGNKSKYIDALTYCVNLDENEYIAFSQEAFDYGKAMSGKNNSLEQYKNLFAN